MNRMILSKSLVIPAVLLVSAMSACATTGPDGKSEVTLESRPTIELKQSEPRSLEGLALPEPHKLGPVIPGLREGAVPQGLAYWKQIDAYLLSHYFDGGRPSCLTVIDRESGKLLGTYALKEDDDRWHSGHVGGVAVNADTVWVASEGKIYRYQTEDLNEKNISGELVPVSVTQ
ncbi:MAG: hypothetical protein N2C12_13905, partial [Planctomycetales bacterium]